MHEIGLCQAILETVERRAAGRPVARIGVRSGALNQVDREAMQLGLDITSLAGPYEGVECELEVVPAEAVCNDCKRASQVESLFSVCPECSSTDITVSGGDELTLTWIEYRDSAVEAKAG